MCAMTEHMLHNLTDLDQGKARHQRTKRMTRLIDKLSSKINQIDGFQEKLFLFEDNLKSSYQETKNTVSMGLIVNSSAKMDAVVCNESDDINVYCVSTSTGEYIHKYINPDDVHRQMDRSINRYKIQCQYTICFCKAKGTYCIIYVKYDCIMSWLISD